MGRAARGEWEEGERCVEATTRDNDEEGERGMSE